MSTHATYLKELQNKVKNLEKEKEEMKLKIKEIENAGKNI